MVLEDIGAVLFVQILGMTEYPGAPFTGDIARDIILFFFIPTVFIILMIWMLIGRFSAAAVNPKLRLLVGVSIYLFILASGYYPIFARLAGPYFIFLIFVLGFTYFILGHFGAGGAAMSGKALSGYAEGVSDEEKIKQFLKMKKLPGPEKTWLMNKYRNLNREIVSLQRSVEKGARVEGLDNMMASRDEIELKIFREVKSDDFRRRYM